MHSWLCVREKERKRERERVVCFVFSHSHLVLCECTIYKTLNRYDGISDGGNSNCSSNIIWFATVDIGRLAFSYASSQAMHSNASSDFEWDCCVCMGFSVVFLFFVSILYNFGLPGFFSLQLEPLRMNSIIVCAQSQFLWYLLRVVCAGLWSSFAQGMQKYHFRCKWLCVCVSAYLTQAIHLTRFKLSISTRTEYQRGKKSNTNKQINKSFFKLVLTRQIQTASFLCFAIQRKRWRERQTGRKRESERGHTLNC